MFILSSRTKKNIEKKIGLSVSNISNNDLSFIKSYIEKKTGKELNFDSGKPLKGSTRGNVYIDMGRFLDIEDTNKKIDKI